jgi:hypothetical protein
MGRVSRTHRLSTTVRNCTRDEGGPFEAGSQVQVLSHRKLSAAVMQTRSRKVEMPRGLSLPLDFGMYTRLIGSGP